MPVVYGDGSGFPKRCFEWTDPKSRVKRKFCIVWLEYPAFLWQRNTPDPPPMATLQVEGVDPRVLRDLQILDTIAFLSRGLSSGVARGMAQVLEEGLESIQKALPSDLTLSH